MVACKLVSAPTTDGLFEPSAGLLAIWLSGWVSEAGPLLYVARDERRARAIAAVAALEPGAKPLLFRPWDCLPYDRAQPSAAAMGQRMAALSRLSESGTTALVVTTVAALAQRIPPPALATENRELFQVGRTLDRDALADFLFRAGYRRDERVDEPGEAALRGSVVDLFPADAMQPVRLEFEENRLAAIRVYDPVTQRSLDSIDAVTIGPAAEALPDSADEPILDQHTLPLHVSELTTLTRCLPEARIVLDGDADAAFRRWADLVADAYVTRRALRQFESADSELRPVVEPAQLYLTSEEWRAKVIERAFVRLGKSTRFDTAPRFTSRRQLAAAVRRGLAASERIAIAVPASDSLHNWLARHLDVRNVSGTEWRALTETRPAVAVLFDAPLPSGFSLDDGLQVVAGEQLPRAAAAPSPGASDAIFVAGPGLAPGDKLVHADHGIAELVGLETMEMDGRAGDHAVLRFAGEKRLLVPVTELDRVWRYGTAVADVALDRIGGATWRSRRDEVAAEIEAASAELARQVAERGKTAGPDLPMPPGYDRFVQRFPYEASPDQAAAIDAVLTDLARGSPPMDRLVCADVSYGKTEVALRAAAVAALNGRQVAVLAPTTLLVGQHLQTFRHRFAGFDLRVEQLSRQSDGKEPGKIRQGLADGSIRIVIGTHALLSPRIRFADLGLVVIDEEQRFGLRQKEALTRLQPGVHLLALSATPIPRTLQAALTGLRELSVIATPPQRRSPVRTYVVPFDAAAVREALLRERRRGGRSFVVVPRIVDLEPMRERLATVVSELDLAVTHGRLPIAELDRLLLEFASGRHDVLLTTSIVEAGLDIPGANTMIVWRADRFGIAQLHQLRGRVGRGRERGACYFLHELGQELPRAARRRLEMLANAESLGAGFLVSAGDLDQRGGGSLMGAEQAGHIRRIGTGLYQHLLQRAVRRAQGALVTEEWRPELAVAVPALLPAEYVPEPEVRLEIYERLAKLVDAEAIDDFAEELADRFGEPPQAAANLLEIARLRLTCRALGVARLEVGAKAAAATPQDGLWQQAAPAGVSVSGDRLILRREAASDTERLAAARELLRLLAATHPSASAIPGL